MLRPIYLRAADQVSSIKCQISGIFCPSPAIEYFLSTHGVFLYNYNKKSSTGSRTPYVNIVSTGFSLSVDNKQADPGRDGQICLSRPYYRRREKGQDAIRFPCSGGHEQG